MDDGILPVMVDGREDGQIVKSHRYGDPNRTVESYEAWFDAGVGGHGRFTVSQHGTARGALAAAKAWVRSEVPLSLAEEADES